MRYYLVETPMGKRLWAADDEAHAREQYADAGLGETVLRVKFTGEYTCPECSQGCYSIRDNRDAPIPIHVPPSVHDDEGRPVDFCPNCDAELTPDNLTGVTA